MKDAEPPTKKMRTFFDTLIDTSSSNVTTPTDIESMIEEYLQSPCLPQESDPLEYWKENNKKFSQLAKLAPNYLCIPASSAPVESLFRIAGKVFRPKQCRLTDNLFQKLMFIKCNQQLQN